MSNITSGPVAGRTSDQNTYSIEGGNAADTLSGDNGYINGFMAGTAAVPTPVESIEVLSTFGYQAAVSIPQSQNFVVGRIDHDFGSNLRGFSSYRGYDSTSPTTDLVDIGGLLPGDTLGVPKSVSLNTNSARYFVTGLTATLGPTVTSDFHFSFLRDQWGGGRGGFIPQGRGASYPSNSVNRPAASLGPATRPCRSMSIPTTHASVSGTVTTPTSGKTYLGCGERTTSRWAANSCTTGGTLTAMTTSSPVSPTPSLTRWVGTPDRSPFLPPLNPFLSFGKDCLVYLVRRELARIILPERQNSPGMRGVPRGFWPSVTLLTKLQTSALALLSA